MTKDLSPYLFGFVPDPAAQDDARMFAALYSYTDRIEQRLEDLLMTFASFHNDHAGQTLPDGLNEAVGVLSFAASGLAAIMEDHPHGQTWAALSLARMWAVQKTSEASADVTAQEAEGLPFAVGNLYMLPAWVYNAAAAGRAKEAGRFAMWYTVARLLEAVPQMEDGEADSLTAAVLEALREPKAAPRADLPGFMATMDALRNASPADAVGMIRDGLAGMREIEEEGGPGLSLSEDLN